MRDGDKILTISLAFHHTISVFSVVRRYHCGSILTTWYLGIKFNFSQIDCIRSFPALALTQQQHLFLDSYLLFIDNNIISSCHDSDIYHRATDQDIESLVECYENDEDFETLAHNLGILTAFSIVRLLTQRGHRERTDRSCWHRIASNQRRESACRVHSCFMRCIERTNIFN